MKMSTMEKILVFVLVIFVAATLWVGFSKSFPKVYNRLENLGKTEEVAEIAEFCEMRAVVEIVEEENPGIFRYEILAEDGNVWVFASKEEYNFGENLIVEFFTEKQTDRTLWEVLEVKRV